MPRKNARRYNKRRQRRKKKTVTLSARQARTRKYDSRIEKVMARVARQEDAKTKPKLIYRQYLFGPYTQSTNVFVGGLQLDRVGAVAPLAQIQLLDNKQVPRVIPLVNPLQNPATWVNPGDNVVGIPQAVDGFRRGIWIYITGVLIELRIKLNALSAQELQDSPGFCNIHYKLMRTQYNGSDLTNAKPDNDEAGSMVKVFGHNSKLDQIIYDETKDRRNQTLFRKNIKMKYDSWNNKVIFKSHFVSFAKKPLKVQYYEEEQNGRRIQRWKPFFCIQSDVPAGANTIAYKPIVHACTKVFYHDS